MPIKVVEEGLKQNTETGRKQPQILENIPQTNGKPQETGREEESRLVSYSSYSQQEQRSDRDEKKEIYLNFNSGLKLLTPWSSF